MKWFEVLALNRVPSWPGLYAVWAKGVLVYIGNSSEMYARLKNHSKRHLFEAAGADSITWVQTPKETYPDWEGRKSDRHRMELWLIQKNRPLLNREPRTGKLYSASKVVVN